MSVMKRVHKRDIKKGQQVSLRTYKGVLRGTCVFVIPHSGIILACPDKQTHLLMYRHIYEGETV